MIYTNDDGTHCTINDKMAEKLRKYDEIVDVLEHSNPYMHNRETCDRIRAIVKGGKQTDG